MKRTMLCTLALTAIVATARADDEKKADPPAPESYQTMAAEFSTQQRELATAFRAAKTEEERQKILAEYNELPVKFADRFLTFAKANPNDASAFDALAWVVANDRGGKVAEKAMPMIVEKYLDDPKIVRLCQQLSRSDSTAAKKFLQTVLDSSKNIDAQGYAAYGLAKAMLGRSGEKNEKAESLLARVVKDFPNVANGSLAKTAERELFEIQHLSIGCEAPEITAEDIDGVEFSLSDYRGKVVVLDFWGDW